jgi:hypothetical protein
MDIRKTLPDVCVLLSLAALIPGCDSPGPTEQSDSEILTPSLSASSEWTRVPAHQEGELYIDCANGGQGEWMYLNAEYVLLIHTVTTANGKEISQIRMDYPPGHPLDMTLVGLETGFSYYMKPGSWNQDIYVPPGGTYVAHETYINENDHRDWIRLRFVWHLTVNANGEVTAYRVSDWCAGGG